MSGLPPDPLEGQQADVDLIYDVVLQSARNCQWSSTGHPLGCDPGGTCCSGLTFKDRAAKGGLHLTICAKELVQVQAAAELVDHLTRGGLRAALSRVVVDPRLGEWRRHLDQWAEGSA